MPFFIACLCARELPPLSSNIRCHVAQVCAEGAVTGGCQVASKLSAEDRERIEKAVEETISWLDSNSLAEADELEDKQKELEAIAQPIFSRMYQQGGGMRHS